MFIETEESFQCRRVRRSIRTIEQTGKTLAKWRVIRESHLRPNFSVKVESEIQKVITLK
jgi:hypothetical protein